MVSRRKFLSILLMMAVLCGIFMFAMFVQESGSTYDVNRFAVEELPSGQNRWRPSGDENIILYFGAEDSAMKNVVEQWCTYTRRVLLQKEKWSEYLVEKDGLPEMILLDAENLVFEKNYSDLAAIAELGIPLVFCSLPPTSDFMIYPELREILGVKVRQLEVEVEGVRLFDGFFLGGPAEYIAKTESDKEFQDFELTIPWFLTQSGTKTYMVGVLDNRTDVKDHQYPCLIWRNNYNNTKVFAVCGDYMSSLAGLGILSAFTYELYSYELYPVVNAQSVIINNFPNFSEENTAEIERLYSRSPQMYFQGIMWPGISALAKTNILKLTCLFKPQYDYSDSQYPEKEEVSFYLKQLRELESEAGLAMGHQENSDFETMLEEDKAFFESLKHRYKYQSTFAEEEDLEKIRQELQKDGLLEQLITISSYYGEKEQLLSYFTDGTTLQRITGTADHHTYVEDFTVHSVQTALLYSNVLMDLKDAVWPQEEMHQWQHLFKDMSSNIQTYWSGKSGLEQTTLSQSDLRVRNFLNLDYSHEREGDRVILEVENTTDEVWFILRTHDEKIEKIKGGTYKKLEKGIYLITAEEEVVELKLTPLTLKEQCE